MNDATSMWSAPIRCEHPRSSFAPCTVSTFEPMPSTCGAHPRQQAAQILDVRLAGGVPDASSRRDASDGRHQRVLGAGHRRLVQIDLGAAQPVGGAQAVLAADVDVGPQRCSAIRWVSTRRRPITSPPGGGTSAAPKRASSGPANRIDARIRSHSSGSSLVLVDVAAHTRTVFWPSHSTSTPSRDDQLDHLLDVPDARDVLERDRVGGQQAGCQDRERGVLVAGGANGAREGRAALDQERFHGASLGLRSPSRQGSHIRCRRGRSCLGVRILAGRWRTTWCTTATPRGRC